MKSFVSRLLGKPAAISEAGSEYVTISFSQEGEDMILKRMFPGLAEGFYIDIGAHHPYRFSNTFFFYKLGWTGINIDPIPGIKALFDAQRPKDINLELAISDTQAVLNYYNFKEKALNTFSEDLSNQYRAANWELENIIPIETFPLANVLDRYMPEGRQIDFMSIDVEDLEMKVLQSNDWKKFRPKVLVIEMLDCPAQEVANTEIAGYLRNIGYLFFAKTLNSSFFKLES
jgi:hypothetical protein